MVNGWEIAVDQDEGGGQSYMKNTDTCSFSVYRSSFNSQCSFSFLSLLCLGIIALLGLALKTT